MSDRELLQQALDALESRCGTNADERKELIPAIRARLAQPEQKPLTDDEIVDMWANLHYEDKEATVVELARAIEAAHNIKETK